MNSSKMINRGAFLLSVVITGAMAGAFVWLVLFLMNIGIGFLWGSLPGLFGTFYPLIMCLIGGVIIGLFSKCFGDYPEGLNNVMAKVKRDGRYEYKDIGKISVAALLPLIFGGSIGPEAGLTGVIAGLCTWVGDRMRRFGSDFRELTEAGMTATLSAIFAAPFYGLAVGMEKTEKSEDDVKMSKGVKAIVYICAIAGALGSMILLKTYVGGGLSLPHYDWESIGIDDILWMIPLILVGALAGWFFCISNSLMAKASGMTDRRVLKSVLVGLILGTVGMVLPLTMFSGEAQIEELNEIWMSLGASLLLIIGFLKILITSACINMGWRGGQFFPLIFAGISIGYGLAALTGTDPIFSLCVVTAALIGGVLRKPLMTVLLLFLCFPVIAVVPMIIAAFIGSRIPLPKSLVS